MAIIRVVGILVFLYLSWRNLRDNYKDKDMGSYGWLALLGMLFGGRVTYGLLNWGVWNDNFADWFNFWEKPGFDYLAGFLSMLGVSFWMAKSRNWKLWPFFEDMTSNWLILFIFLMVDELLRTGFDTKVIYILGSLFLTLGTVEIVKSRYRSYWWYRSGKKGFVFFWGGMVFWLSMALVSIVNKEAMVAKIFLLFLCLISLVGLFMLGDILQPLLVKKKK